MNVLKAIAIFVEIADQGSMSSAARSLGVVNSVISKNLNELEAWLGQKLIFRSTRNMRLTQGGQAYLEQCREILAKVNALQQRTNEDDNAIHGTVMLTAPLFLGQHLLAPILGDFYQRYPSIKMQVVLSDDFRDMVEEGFDIALRASQMPDSSFISRRLRASRIKLVASPAYLQKQGAPSSLQALKAHQCLVEGEGAGRKRWRFKGKKGRQASISVDGNFRLNNGNMVKALCEQGMGIAQLPDFFIEEALANGNLVELLPDCDLDNVYLHLLYHQRSTGNQAVKVAVDYLVERLGNY